jgi:hypothetical protein
MDGECIRSGRIRQHQRREVVPVDSGRLAGVHLPAETAQGRQWAARQAKAIGPEQHQALDPFSVPGGQMAGNDSTEGKAGQAVAP